MPKIFKKESQQQTGKQEAAQQDDEPVRTILDWKAPSRPFRKRDFSYYRTIAIIAVLSILIAFLMKEALLIGAIMALAFVIYVLGFIPPEEINYKISTQGITIGESFYFWDSLDSFWFSEKEKHTVLNILTRLRFPAQLIIMIGSQNQDEMKNIVARYLPYHEIPPKSIMDKWADSLQKHFPLEKSSG